MSAGNTRCALHNMEMCAECLGDISAKAALDDVCDLCGLKVGHVVHYHPQSIPGTSHVFVSRAAARLARGKERVARVNQHRAASATREAYIRGCASAEAYDCHIGLEWRTGDDVPALAEWVRELAFEALFGNVDRGHEQIVRHAEYYILQRWPARAYFIETDIDGCGVQ